MELPENYPRSFDAYLKYAIQTEFAYFGGLHGRHVALLVELRLGVTPTMFSEAVSSFDERVIMGPTEFEDRSMIPTRYVSVRGAVGILAPATWPVWDKLTQYVELSVPVAPGAPLKPSFIDKDRPKSGASTVLAIIDDGCTFADARVRYGAKLEHSRVFAIWDQNSRAPAPVQDGGAPRVFGSIPVDFAYGIEYRRTPPSSKEVGIDEWIALHRTPSGAVDEEACYRDAGFESLACQNSHGAHVMDVLAGRVATKSRLSYEPTRPPTFEPAADPASADSTDIIFIQIPRFAVDDASGKWLPLQVRDAAYFILSCIHPGKKIRVIVNLSYGPTTEPHDGKGNLEQWMSEIVDIFDGTSLPTSLSFVLPAGNSRLSDAHVVFKSQASNETKSWAWRLSPDNPVPVFAEIWVKRSEASAVSGRLIAPHPYVGQAPVITVLDALPDSICWLVVLPPTQALPAAATGDLPGPHGDWTIELTLAIPGVEVHVYLARSDPNMGARVAAKPTRFLDPAWERANGARAEYMQVDGVRDLEGSLIRRTGTLNGIATTSVDRIFVAGGYRLRDGKSSRYASVGPSRGVRQGPDYALPSDESLALLGIRAAGTRSGATFRLMGTSTAAPQLARHLANGTALPSCPTGDPAVGCGIKPAP